MNISFSATNPCHVYDCARALHRLGHLGTYYSGYPNGRLRDSPPSFPSRSFPLRTLITYGALKTIPPAFRPADHRLFRWQDNGFDRAVARHLTPCDEIHGLPGQCEHTFRAAKSMGIRTVLNHATGPSRDLEERVRAEFDRVGMIWEDHTPYTPAFRAREDREWELADQHCVASHEVRHQLIQHGIPRDLIRVVPYGADPALFFPAKNPRPEESTFRILFAGHASLRKGLHTVWEAIDNKRPPHWRMDHVGSFPPEIAPDWAAVTDRKNLFRHGPVSQQDLGEWMRKSDLLVLPSWEEGFGLVVVQALACGIPCLVSERVGARDLITPGQNGDILPVGDAGAWRAALEHWDQRRPYPPVAAETSWDTAAQALISPLLDEASP